MTKEEKKQYAKEVREWRKAHGICIRCGKFDAEPGKTMCLICMMDCRDYAREQYRKKTETMTEEERQARNEANRRRYSEKRESGICQQCSNPVFRNHAYCYKHYISQSHAHGRERKKKYPYHPIGTCRICGAEPEPGFKMCPTHRKEYSDRMIKYNKERSEKKNGN